ncbi:MAG: hypothetical protein WHT29_11830 [Bacteroidales bacterium]
MIRVTLLSIITSFIITSCDPDSVFTECTYEYPINAVGLKDSIKTTDTIWIINDLDAKLCLNKGIYKNGKGYEYPSFFKLEGDTFQSYDYNLVIIGSNMYSFVNNRYKLKYGIAFKEKGIYLLTRFCASIENGVDAKIFIQGYFNVESNNSNLVPSNVKIPAPEIGQPYKYYVYFIKVIE